MSNLHIEVFVNNNIESKALLLFISKNIKSINRTHIVKIKQVNSVDEKSLNRKNIILPCIKLNNMVTSSSIKSINVFKQILMNNGSNGGNNGGNGGNGNNGGSSRNIRESEIKNSNDMQQYLLQLSLDGVEKGDDEEDENPFGDAMDAQKAIAAHQDYRSKSNTQLTKKSNNSKSGGEKIDFLNVNSNTGSNDDVEERIPGGKTNNDLMNDYFKNNVGMDDNINFLE